VIIYLFARKQATLFVHFSRLKKNKKKSRQASDWTEGQVDKRRTREQELLWLLSFAVGLLLWPTTVATAFGLPWVEYTVKRCSIYK